MNNIFSQTELLAVLSNHRSADFHIGNHIPTEKLTNARAYFPIQRGEKVVGLIDCTVFGSCKVGLAITLNGLVWKNDWTTDSTQTVLTWHELAEISDTIRAVGMDVEFAPGIKFNMAGCSMKPAALIALCLALVDLVEKEGSSHLNDPDHHSKIDLETDIETLFIALIAKFTKVDGVITPRQIAFIENVFDGMSDNNVSEKKRYIAIFNRAKDEDVSINHLARQLVAENSDADFFTEFYDLLWQVAISEGPPSVKKCTILRDIPAIFGLSNKVYEEATKRYVHKDRTSESSQRRSTIDLTKHYQILGCAPSVSDEELKMAYRRKMSSLHPDKLQAKELAHEIIEFATQQVQKINHAYEQIAMHRLA